MLAASLATNGGSSQAILTVPSSSSPVGNGPTLQTDSVLSKLIPDSANSTDGALSNAVSWSAFQAKLYVEPSQYALAPSLESTWVFYHDFFAVRFDRGQGSTLAISRCNQARA